MSNIKEMDNLAKKKKKKKQKMRISRKTHLPGSMPSVFGALDMGARIVIFLIVTFLQSYGCNVQKGESRKVMFDIKMSLDHIICTSGPLV